MKAHFTLHLTREIKVFYSKVLANRIFAFELAALDLSNISRLPQDIRFVDKYSLLASSRFEFIHLYASVNSIQIRQLTEVNCVCKYSSVVR